MRRARLRPDASRPRDHPPDGIRRRRERGARCSVPGDLPAARRGHGRGLTRGHRPSRRVRRLRRARGILARELEQGFRGVQAEAGAPADEVEPADAVGAHRGVLRAARERRRRRAHHMRPGQRVRAVGIQMGAQDRRARRVRRSRRQTQGGVLVGSKHGDPRDVLLTEDAGAIAPFDAPGPDQAQAFVFNRQTDGRVRVFSDFVEGFNPPARAASSCPAAVSPRWRFTTRSGCRGCPRAGPSPRARPRLAPPWTTHRGGTRSRRQWDAFPRRSGSVPGWPTRTSSRLPPSRGSLRVPDHGAVAAVRLQRRFKVDARRPCPPFPRATPGPRRPPSAPSSRPHPSAGTPPAWRWSRRRRRWTASRLFARPGGNPRRSSSRWRWPRRLPSRRRRRRRRRFRCRGRNPAKSEDPPRFRTRSPRRLPRWRRWRR